MYIVQCTRYAAPITIYGNYPEYDVSITLGQTAAAQRTILLLHKCMYNSGTKNHSKLIKL